MSYQARDGRGRVLHEGPDFLAVLAWHRLTEHSQQVTDGDTLLAYRTSHPEGKALLERRTRQARARGKSL